MESLSSAVGVLLKSPSTRMTGRLSKRRLARIAGRTNAKKRCLNDSTGDMIAGRSVKYRNKAGTRVRVILAPQQRIGPFCSICHEEKITAYPVCKICDRHVVCGKCIQGVIHLSICCPECNTDVSKVDDKYIQECIKGYKMELNLTGFKCDQCSFSDIYLNVEKHVHEDTVGSDTPWEDPFCYRRTVQYPSRLSDEMLTEAIDDITRQLRSEPAFMRMQLNFFERLGISSSQLIQIRSRSGPRFTQPLVRPPIPHIAFMESFQACFRHMEDDPERITLERLKRAVAATGFPSLADSLTCPLLP